MRNSLKALPLSFAALMVGNAFAQIPTLPAGAQTHWIISQPHEIVTWLTFNPATVSHRLPSALRFITVQELASTGVSWARDYLAQHPGHSLWGVSFLEIVRCKTFTIDGRSPIWPKNGAVALWFARVAPTNPSTNLGPGQPFLALEFWVPDDNYAAYMCSKGHYASFGKIQLTQDSDGNWNGSINSKTLRLTAKCMPAGPITGGPGSAGLQVFFPPSEFSAKTIVRVAFAGHRIQDCTSDSSWERNGTHPIVSGIILQPSNYEFGYELVGGAYPFDLYTKSTNTN